MNAGKLFEEALVSTGINLKPGTEFTVKVHGKGAHLKLVLSKRALTEFEQTVLERSKNTSKNKAPYVPKLSLGEKIRAFRKGRGLTLEKLAKLAQISKGSLCSIEKNERAVGLNVLKRLAKALDISISFFTE